MRDRLIGFCVAMAFCFGGEAAPSFGEEIEHVVTASSSADPADVATYRRIMTQGGSREEALERGDDGVGMWGDDTTDVRKPLCALPPEDWRSKWGGGRRARGKKIAVTYRGKTVVRELRDSMPPKREIKNGAGIDLNPGAARAFGVRPPFMLSDVRWRWAE